MISKRLNSLLRKSKAADTNPSLISALLPHLTMKREFEDALEDAGSAQAFAMRIGLDAPQTALLLQLQAAKDIHVPHPRLDAALTAVFLVEVCVVCSHFWADGLLGVFLLCLCITDAVTHRVKSLSTSAGVAFSTWLHLHGYVDSDALAAPIQRKKWAEQSWQLFIHIAFSSAQAVILSSEPWYEHPLTCWVPHPTTQAEEGFRWDLQVVYVSALAVWIYTCFVHRFLDERRKDYFVMYVHHIVTIALVAGSWAARYLRIGLLVMWVHDVSDVFIDVLKMVNYLKLEGMKGCFGSEIAYVATMVSWAYWRLYQFPFVVLRASFFDIWRVLATNPRPASWAGLGIFGELLPLFPSEMPAWPTMNALLFVLCGLHVYWFGLLGMVGYRIATESAREASRQEYEGLSDEEEEEKKVEKGSK